MLHPMRFVTAGILSIFLLASLYLWAGQRSAVSPDYTAYVTIKVRNAATQQWPAIENHLSTFTDLEVDFVCHESGIMVWRIMHTEFAESADVQIMVRNRLAPILGTTDYSVLDIHLTSSPTEGNC